MFKIAQKTYNEDQDWFSDIFQNKTFVVYTDGVTEGYLKNGNELGVEGVKNIIAEIEEINPKNIIDNIVDNLNFDDVKLRDDITCLSIKIN